MLELLELLCRRLGLTNLDCVILETVIALYGCCRSVKRRVAVSKAVGLKSVGALEEHGFVKGIWESMWSFQTVF